jgi:hypothetical protein
VCWVRFPLFDIPGTFWRGGGIQHEVWGAGKLNLLICYGNASAPTSSWGRRRFRCWGEIPGGSAIELYGDLIEINGIMDVSGLGIMRIQGLVLGSI